MADTFLKRAYNRFVGQGWAPHQAAALAGQAQWESGGSPTIEDPRGEGSRGIFQWRLDRRTGLNTFAKARGLNPDDENTQLDYAHWELTEGPEKKWGDALRNAQDLPGATNATISFLRPAGWTAANPTAGHGYANRYNYAAGLIGAPTFSGAPSAPVQTAQAPAQTPDTDPLADRTAAAAMSAVSGLQQAQARPQSDDKYQRKMSGLTSNGLAMMAQAAPQQPAPLIQSPIYRPQLQPGGLLASAFPNRRPTGGLLG